MVTKHGITQLQEIQIIQYVQREHHIKTGLSVVAIAAVGSRISSPPYHIKSILSYKRRNSKIKSKPNKASSKRRVTNICGVYTLAERAPPPPPRKRSFATRNRTATVPIRRYDTYRYTYLPTTCVRTITPYLSRPRSPQHGHHRPRGCVEINFRESPSCSTAGCKGYPLQSQAVRRLRSVVGPAALRSKPGFCPTAAVAVTRESEGGG